jgi:hypothetical protein
MNPIYNPSDAVPVVATVDPQLGDNAAYTSDWVDMGKFAQVMFILLVGATDITIDAKIQSADDSSGTNAADLPTAVALTQIPGTDDNKQFILSVREDQLNTGDTHVALVVTVGNGAVGAQISAVGLGFGSNYLPASEHDLSSVAQIVPA